MRLSNLLVEAAKTEQNSCLRQASLTGLIHLTAPEKINQGVQGLLYEANTASALAFPDD